MARSLPCSSSQVAKALMRLSSKLFSSKSCTVISAAPSCADFIRGSTGRAVCMPQASPAKCTSFLRPYSQSLSDLTLPDTRLANEFCFARVFRICSSIPRQFVISAESLFWFKLSTCLIISSLISSLAYAVSTLSPRVPEGCRGLLFLILILKKLSASFLGDGVPFTSGLHLVSLLLESSTINTGSYRPPTTSS